MGNFITARRAGNTKYSNDLRTIFKRRLETWYEGLRRVHHGNEPLDAYKMATDLIKKDATTTDFFMAVDELLRTRYPNPNATDKDREDFTVFMVSEVLMVAVGAAQEFAAQVVIGRKYNANDRDDYANLDEDEGKLVFLVNPTREDTLVLCVFFWAVSRYRARDAYVRITEMARRVDMESVHTAAQFIAAGVEPSDVVRTPDAWLMQRACDNKSDYYVQFEAFLAAAMIMANASGAAEEEKIRALVRDYYTRIKRNPEFT